MGWTAWEKQGNMTRQTGAGSYTSSSLGDQTVNVFACFEHSKGGPQLPKIDSVPAIIVTVQHCVVLLQNLQSFLVHGKHIGLYMRVGTPVSADIALKW